MTTPTPEELRQAASIVGRLADWDPSCGHVDLALAVACLMDMAFEAEEAEAAKTARRERLVNDDKLIGLIARTLYGQNAIYDAQTGDGIPWEEVPGYQECWQRDAEGLLAVLRTAGYAIVELPKPAEAVKCWPVLVGGEPESLYLTPDGEVVVSGSLRLYADEARDLAAALLAAADYAEREQ